MMAPAQVIVAWRSQRVHSLWPGRAEQKLGALISQRPPSPCQVGFPRSLAGCAPRAHKARTSRSVFREKSTSGFREETTATSRRPRGTRRSGSSAGGGRGRVRRHRRPPPGAGPTADSAEGLGRPRPSRRSSGRERSCENTHVAASVSPTIARHEATPVRSRCQAGEAPGCPGGGATSLGRVWARRIKNGQACVHLIKSDVYRGRSRPRSPCTPKLQSRGAGLACGSASEGSLPCPAAEGKGWLSLLGPQKGVRAQDPRASVLRGEAQRGRVSETWSL